MRPPWFIVSALLLGAIVPGASGGPGACDVEAGDWVVMQWQQTDLVFREHFDAEATLWVERQGDANCDATVLYATQSGSAVAGDDYIETQGSLLFPAGDFGPKPVTIRLLDDAISEGGSVTFAVVLTGTPSAEVAFERTAHVKLLDDIGALYFDWPFYDADETDLWATMTVKRWGEADRAAQVTVALVGGTAVNGQDIQWNDRRLTFYQGERVKTLAVEMHDDSLRDGAKTARFELRDFTPLSWPATPATAVLTIRDNESPRDPAAEPDRSPTPFASVQLSRPEYHVQEDAGSLTVDVFRSGDLSGELSVTWSVSHGTSDGQDLFPQSGTMVFAAGQTSQTFVVAVLDDARKDGDQTAHLVLTSPSGAVALGEPSFATIWLEDDESRPDRPDQNSDDSGTQTVPALSLLWAALALGALVVARRP